MKQILIPFVCFALLAGVRVSASESEDRQLRSEIRAYRNLAELTILNKHCSTTGGKRAETSIEDTWRKTFERVKFYAGKDGNGWIGRLKSVRMYGKEESQAISVPDDMLIKQLEGADFRIGSCTGDRDTACTTVKKSAIGLSISIIVSPALIDGICKTLNPGDVVISLQRLETAAKAARAESLRQIELSARHESARALMLDYRYAASRVFVVAHEATHAILQPHESDQSPRVNHELVADMGAIGLLARFDSAELLGFPLDAEDVALRKGLHEYGCYEGVSTMLTVVQKFGFHDIHSGDLPPENRRDAFLDSFRRTKMCNE